MKPTVFECGTNETLAAAADDVSKVCTIIFIILTFLLAIYNVP
jgi:hypothetical protein